MTVGDIITGSSAVATPITFQPAAGVEIMITCIAVFDATIQMQDTLGPANLMNTTAVGFRNSNIKMGITNTNYLTILAAAAAQPSIYTGIQIK